METSLKKIKEKRLMKLMLLPLSFVLGFIPMIVLMKDATPEGDIQNKVLHVFEYYDFFSQYKSQVLMYTVIVMMVLLFFLYDKSYIKKDKYTLTGIAGAIVFLVGAILSTIFSEYREVALWGTYDRAEGLVSIGCYVVVLLYSIYAFNEYKDIKYVVIPLSILIIVNAIIGVTQYFGYDIYKTSDWVKQIIVPESLADTRDELTTSYADKRVYGTVGHYNYMGSFTALLVPFFVVLTIMIKGTIKKIGLMIVSVAALFLLFGSTSRAGLVGVAVAALVVLILLGKKVLHHWKVGIGVVAILGILLVFFNFITAGSIFARIPSLIEDMKQVVTIGGEKEDYRDYLPMREFRNEQGEVVIVLQEGELHFSAQEGKIVVTDELGNSVQYVNIDVADANMSTQQHVEGTYRTQDPLFGNIEYKLSEAYIEGDFVPSFIVRTVDNQLRFTCRIDYNQNRLQQVDEWTGEDVQQETAPFIGFEGSEKLGSSRGYIWSRTLPMLKDTLLIGKGPDNFAFYFTRYDGLAKLWSYGVQKVIVDKPHNIYLQIAYNEGVVALVGFLVLVGSYMIGSIKLYAFKESYNTKESIGLAITAGITGYLAAGIFNDSAISVAPIFWVLLGVGIVINQMKGYEEEDSTSIK